MILTALMLAGLVSACQPGAVAVVTGPDAHTLSQEPSGAMAAGRSGVGDVAAAGEADPAGRGTPSSGPTTEPGTIDHRVYALYAAGVELALAGRWQEALARFTEARSLDPASSHIALHIADCLEHLGERGEALAGYERAAGLAPEDFRAQAALGEALERRGRLADAGQAYQRALATPNADPDTGEYVLTLWRLASVAERGRRRKEAIAHYQRLLELLSHPKPDYRGYRRVWALVEHREFVYEELGKLHLLEGDLKSAIRLFEEGRLLAPTAITIAYRLADAYLRDEEPARALAEVDRLLEMAGDEPVTLGLLVRAARALKKPEEAVRRLETRLKAAPDNLLLRFHLATVYRETDRLLQAEQLLRTVLEEQPQSALAHAELAATLRLQKRLDKAYDALAEAVDREALAPPVLLEIDRVTEALKKDTDAARRWQSQVREGRSDSRGTQYLLGHLLANLGQHQEAAEVLAGVLRANPTFLWAYVDLAAVRTRQKQYAEALEVYRGALKQGLKGNPLIYRMMARLHERLDQLPEAMKAVDEALKLAPADRESRYLKALLLDRMGKDDQAEQAFRAILAEDPDDPDANNALSYFLAMRNRQLDEARRLIDRTLRREPDNGAYLDTLGWVLYQQGKYQEALEVLRRAAEAIKEHAPQGDPVILDHLGDAHHRLGQPEEARRAWQEALKVNEEGPNPELNPKKVQEKLDALPK